MKRIFYCLTYRYLMYCKNLYQSIQQQKFTVNNHRYYSIVIQQKFRRLSSEFQKISEIKSKICWNCQTESQNLSSNNSCNIFCDKCGLLQLPNPKINYFQLLSLKPAFAVNSIELTKIFRELQNLVHPDRFSNNKEEEKSLSQEWSSLINKAYKTLATPIERGQYMLELVNQTLPEDNSSVNVELLAEMMDRNEEIEDAAHDIDKIKKLLEQIQEDLNHETEILGKLFDVQNYDGAKGTLIKMKYLKSIENNIKLKIQNINDSTN